jgi:hypothetical protein
MISGGGPFPGRAPKDQNFCLNLTHFNIIITRKEIKMAVVTLPLQTSKQPTIMGMAFSISEIVYLMIFFFFFT